MLNLANEMWVCSFSHCFPISEVIEQTDPFSPFWACIEVTDFDLASSSGGDLKVEMN